MSEIFISYASVDRERARQLADALTRRGWSVWWDRTIPPGRTFDEVIEEALDDAKCVIVLWSRASVASKWVKTEAAEGDRRNILVPVLLEDVRIPLEFRRIQAARITDWDGDESDGEFTNLCASVASTIRAVASEGSGPRRVVTEGSPLSQPARSRWSWPGRRHLKKIVLGTVVVVALAGGYKYWSDYREGVVQAERRVKEAEEARRTEEARRVEAARRVEEALGAERARKAAEVMALENKRRAEAEQRSEAEQRAEAQRRAIAERSAREAEEAKRVTAAREGAARSALDAARSTPASDTATISAISPLPGTALPRLSLSGPPMLFRMTVRYRLTSADRAILAVYVEEFPDTPGRCLGSTHRTQAGETASIGRGEGEITVVVGARASAPSGYLAPGMNIWPDSGGRPGSPVIREFGVQSAFCYRFGGGQ